MVLELLSLLFTFENSSHCVGTSFDSDSFLYCIHIDTVELALSKLV